MCWGTHLIVKTLYLWSCFLPLYLVFSAAKARNERFRFVLQSDKAGLSVHSDLHHDKVHAECSKTWWLESYLCLTKLQILLLDVSQLQDLSIPFCTFLQVHHYCNAPSVLTNSLSSYFTLRAVCFQCNEPILQVKIWEEHCSADVNSWTIKVQNSL